MKTAAEQPRHVYAERGWADPALSCAVVSTDHQQARVLEFDGSQVQSRTFQLLVRPTAQPCSGIRSEHQFFGAVCDALYGIAQVLVTGPHIALTDFRHYASKYRPLVATSIVGYELADHPTDRRLVAQARAYFQRVDLLDGHGMLRA